MHSDLLPFCYGSSRTRVLALDLAKNETGYAHLEIDTVPHPHSAITWLDWGRFKPDARNDKLLFVTATELAKTIGEIISFDRMGGYNVAVIIEHPTFGGSRGPQQFLIFSAVLAMLELHSVNVTTVSTGFLKAFVKTAVPDAKGFMTASNAALQAARAAEGKNPAKIKPGLTKAHIKEIYDSAIAPVNPTWPQPTELPNDDVYDAVCLGALGALFCGDLPDLDLSKCDLFDVRNGGNPPWYARSLWTNPLAFVPAEPRTYTNCVWREAGLKAIAKAHKENARRKPDCKLDFLFNQLALAARLYADKHTLDPKGTEAWVKAQATKGGRFGKRTILDHEPTSRLRANYAGLYYLHHSLRHLSARANAI